MCYRVTRNYILNEVFLKVSKTTNMLVIGIRKINLVLCIHMSHISPIVSGFEIVLEKFTIF